MVKVIFQTLLGLAFTFAGLYFGYLNFNANGLASRDLHSLILPAILMLFGVLFLIRAGRSDATIGMQKEKELTIKGSSKKEKLSILEQNNEIYKEWSRTYEQREKLKMLEVAANAAEQKQKETY